MKSSPILRGAALAAAVLSFVWVALLAALVARCLWRSEPFPVLAKFSAFHQHLRLTDHFLTWYPALAVVSLLALGAAWVRAGHFTAVRGTAGICLTLVGLPLLVILTNPGGYFSWLLS